MESIAHSARRDFIVGAFVLAGIAALAWLSINVSGLRWHARGGLKLSASFNETGTLAARAPVVIAGVRVGQISQISLDKNFRAKVEMDLDPSLQLPKDSSAAIVTAGMLGDRYIELTPGGDEQMLKTGDTITFTESAVLLERLIGQLVYGSTKGSKPGAVPGPATGPTTGPATGPATSPATSPQP